MAVFLGKKESASSPEMAKEDGKNSDWDSLSSVPFVGGKRAEKAFSGFIESGGDKSDEQEFVNNSVESEKQNEGIVEKTAKKIGNKLVDIVAKLKAGLVRQPETKSDKNELADFVVASADFERAFFEGCDQLHSEKGAISRIADVSEFGNIRRTIEQRRVEKLVDSFAKSGVMGRIDRRMSPATAGMMVEMLCAGDLPQFAEISADSQEKILSALPLAAIERVLKSDAVFDIATAINNEGFENGDMLISTNPEMRASRYTQYAHTDGRERCSGLFRKQIAVAVGMKIEQFAAMEDGPQKEELGAMISDAFSPSAARSLFSRIDSQTRSEMFDKIADLPGISRMDAATTLLSADTIAQMGYSLVGKPADLNLAQIDKLHLALCEKETASDEFFATVPRDERVLLGIDNIRWVFSIADRSQKHREVDLSELNAAHVLKARHRAWRLGLEEPGLSGFFSAGEEVKFGMRADTRSDLLVSDMLFGEQDDQLAQDLMECDANDEFITQLAYAYANGDYESRVGTMPRSREEFEAGYEGYMRSRIESFLKDAETSSGKDPESAMRAIESARADLCRLALGAQPSYIMKSLLTCGVLRGVDPDVYSRTMSTEEVFTPTERGKGFDYANMQISFERLQTLSPDERGVLLYAAGLIAERGSDDAQDISIIRQQMDDVSPSRSVRREIRGAIDRMTQESRERTSKEWTERLQHDFEECTEPMLDENGQPLVENVDGVEVPILQIRRDNAAGKVLLVSNLGIFGKAGSRDRTAENWDETDTLGAARNIPMSGCHEDGSRAGYISTSLIPSDGRGGGIASFSNGSMIYGFLDLGEKGLVEAHTRDAYTEIEQDMKFAGGFTTSSFGGLGGDSAITTTIASETLGVDDFIASHGGKFGASYDEVVLDRFGGSEGKRLRPSYIVISSSFSEENRKRALEHAAYFGVPVVQIS